MISATFHSCLFKRNTSVCVDAAVVSGWEACLAAIHNESVVRSRETFSISDIHEGTFTPLP